MKQKKPLIKRLIPVVLILAVLIALIAALVNAYYIRYSDEVTNTFAPAVSINPTVKEVFKENDKKVKEDVYFEVGETEYPVYVRAEIVITWKKEDGTVYFSKPIKDTDYEIELNEADWTKKDDGFYYYKESVESGDKTSYLINRCFQKEDAVVPAEGYTLSVEVIVQTIQAVGNTDDSSESPAWEDAGWKNS